MRRHAFAALATLALISTPASAGVVVHQYSGVITAVFDGMTGAPIAFPDFRVGDAFDGCFSYDTASPDQFPANADLGRYSAPADRFAFSSPGFSMTATDVLSDVALFPWAESVSSSGQTPVLPPGWSVPNPASLSDSYSVIFQNAPSLGVLATDALQTTINIADWVSYREMRLDFYDGVTSPSATTTQRLIVQGEILSVSPAPTGTACGSGTSGDPLDALCPPGGPWENHGDYVSCVAHATQDMMKAGTMTHDERQAILTGAAQSDTGK